MSENFLLETQRAALEEIERVRREILQGQVVEVIGVAIRTDENYRIFGGSTHSRRAMAGLLLELAIERLRESE